MCNLSCILCIPVDLPYVPVGLPDVLRDAVLYLSVVTQWLLQYGKNCHMFAHKAHTTLKQLLSAMKALICGNKMPTPSEGREIRYVYYLLPPLFFN